MPARLFAYVPALLAVGLCAWELARPGAPLVGLAAFSLVLSVAWLVLHPRTFGAAVSFLPAVLFAAQLGTPRALVATAIALQARVWLLRAVARRNRERAEWAAALEARKPDQSSVFVDNDIESAVPPGTLREGHLFRLDAGQTAPADGTVNFGSGFVNETLLPDYPDELRMKGMGSSLFEGTRSKNGSFLVRVTHEGAQTFLARLAARVREGAELHARPLLTADLLVTWVLAGVLYALAGPAGGLAACLIASGAGARAAIAAFEGVLAEAAASRRWLWHEGGLRRLARAGMLVTTAPGVLSEGRPRLAGVATTGGLSEDAALGLLAPLARKIETPCAFAVLVEIRTRNIPLQQVDFFEPREDGGTAVVAGEDLRWITLSAAHGSALSLGDLTTFVEQHQNAGDEICLLERQGAIQAALAFHDAPIAGVPAAAEALRNAGVPVLLVSPQSKRSVARAQSELGIEHAQGEAGMRETEALVDRLASEKLRPAWVQAGTQRPARASATVALPGTKDRADLVLPELALPEVTAALRFGRVAWASLRLALGCLHSSQLGLLIAALLANPRVASGAHLGAGWALDPLALALLGVLPSFVATSLVSTRRLMR